MFTWLWSTRLMAATRLIGIDGRVDLTLDGLTFRRSKSASLSRGTSRLHHVEWSRIVGAELARSRKGRPIVRISVRDALPVSRHREDPYAVKVKRKSAERAHAFVELVNEEIALRGRWRAAPEPEGLGSAQGTPVRVEAPIADDDDGAAAGA